MAPLRCCVHSRIIQLWEPFKESQLTRSVESWQNLVTKLRQLLLLSFNRHLGKFEDQVRSLREKRTEPRWSFTTYFLLHVGTHGLSGLGFKHLLCIISTLIEHFTLSYNRTNIDVLILSFLLFRKNCHLCLRCLACSKKP